MTFEIKSWAQYIVTPIMLCVVLFTTGDNGTWDSFLAFLCIALYSLVGIAGLFQIVGGVILFKNFTEYVDDIKSADATENSILQKVTATATMFEAHNWYKWLYAAVIVVSQIAVFVHVKWTGTLIWYTITYTIFCIGTFLMVKLTQKAIAEIESQE